MADPERESYLYWECMVTNKVDYWCRKKKKEMFIFKNDVSSFTVRNFILDMCINFKPIRTFVSREKYC
jgi:hypothetical protein